MGSPFLRASVVRSADAFTPRTVARSQCDGNAGSFAVHRQLIKAEVVELDKVFYTSDYGTGCALLSLTAKDGTVNANEVYFNRDMINHHGGVVLHDGYLYGSSNAILTCMEFATGRVAWKDRSVGKASLTYADGHLYLLSENNVAGLAEATPEGYREKGRFNIADQGQPSWAHPVVCGGQLYLRNQGTLTCYNIK